MAMNEYLTDAGSELLSKMLAGRCQITFTKVQMGDGTLSPGQSRRQMTSLINVKSTMDVYDTKLTLDKIVEVTAIFDNSELTEGFYYREKGIWATDGTNEILFTYSNVGSDAEYINPPSLESVEKEIISLYKGLQSTTAPINITIASGIYALRTDLPDKATTTNLGLVKPDGTTITINSDGVISGSSQVDIATVSKAGIVKPDGDSLSIDTSGKLTVEKVGGLAFSVDSDGILNVTYEED